MRSSRLTLALESGAVSLPDEGRIAVFGASAEADLSALPQDRVQVVQGFRPDHDAWAARGVSVAVAPEGAFVAAVIFAPRAKDLAHAWIARAISLVAGGPVIVDGQKTDGIDSLLKGCRQRGQVDAPLSKAHGKLFSVTGTPEGFAPWQGAERALEGGFITAPGVFSADGIDRGSALLAQMLPGYVKGRVADLGAGWGYLAAQALQHPGVKELHLVEADAAALDCARRNVVDDRARFHWADATRWSPPACCDVVITNPPFHTSRAADPGLGQAFLQNAARILTPAGTLFAVANRHLPYERQLSELFRDVEEIGGDGGFKVLRASRPLGAARGRR